MMSEGTDDVYNESTLFPSAGSVKIIEATKAGKEAGA
jgi:hypothetical protein